MKNRSIKSEFVYIAFFLLTLASCNEAPEKSETMQDEIGELENYMTDKPDTSGFNELRETTSGRVDE